jgi:hypothetical protein
VAEKDERLWMRFPIAFDEDPLIEMLSDSAFRAFVAMNGYSRRNDLDGVIPLRVAVKKWGRKAIDELAAAGRADSPFFEVSDESVVLTKYDRHQDTTEARAKRSATNAKNGRKGGAKRAANRIAKQVASKSLSELGSETQAETEIETETEVASNEATPRKRGTRVPRDFMISEEMRQWARTEVPLVDVDRKLAEWIDYWAGVPGAKGVKLDWESTWRNGMRKQQEFAERDAPHVKSARDPDAWMQR